uniref:Uncharacterized protein n=1 Tax=Amphimedon queenslandica TaxID=400682 RepID=A0A1X7U5N1_AMPQE
MAEEDMKHKNYLRRAQRAVITKTIKVVDDLVKRSLLEEAHFKQKRRSFSAEVLPGVPLTIASSTLTTHTSLVTTAPTTSVHSRVKLPELTPKKFNGDLMKWATFWDMFKFSVHHSCTSRQVHLPVIFVGTASI